MFNTNKNTVKTEPFNFYGKGTSLGVIAGIGMAMITIAMAGSQSVAGSFVKYLLLAPFLFFGLYQLRNTFIKGNFFKEGILLGLYTSFVAALAFVGINLLAISFGLFESEKFSYIAQNFGEVIGFQGVSFFEIISLGMIITFIFLQLLKFTGINEAAGERVTQ